MPTSPCVSVVMPVYNGQAFLARALDSISHQTYRDLEIVVVNDGSTDDTASLLDVYKCKEPRLRVYHQPSTGLAGALNHGCNKAVGRYLARMDADDVAYPNRIALQVDIPGSAPAGRCCGDTSAPCISRRQTKPTAFSPSYFARRDPPHDEASQWVGPP